MGGFIYSFFTVAAGGALISALAPAGKMKKSVSFICAIVLLCVAVTSVGSCEGPNVEIKTDGEKQINETIRQTQEELISRGFCDELCRYIRDNYGQTPEVCRAEVCFDGEEALLKSVTLGGVDKYVAESVAEILPEDTEIFYTDGE